jgi:hypothetical protein
MIVDVNLLKNNIKIYGMLFGLWRQMRCQESGQKAGQKSCKKEKVSK